MKRISVVAGLLLAAAALEGIAIAQASMATVIIDVKTGDAPGNGRIRVLTSNGDEVAHGGSGQAINVPPGVYVLSVQNLDLVDKPERRRRDVELDAGAPTRHTSEWPVAEVKLITRVGGRPTRTQVVLQHQGGGTPVATFYSGTLVKISPGRYQADVHHGQNVTTVTGLQFIEGAIQEIPVSVR
jgi:hypothetical protein